MTESQGGKIFVNSANSKGELASTTIRNALLSALAGIALIAKEVFGIELPEGICETLGTVGVGLLMLWVGYKTRKGRIEATQPIKR